MNDRILTYMAYHPVRTQRGLEILSGLIPWTIIIFPFVGSLFIPEIVAYFVIAFNFYFLYRSLQLSFNAVLGYLNLKATQKVDWFKTLQSESGLNKIYPKIQHLVVICNYKESAKTLERTLDSLTVQNFPNKNFFIVLAMEEREGDAAYERATYLLRKYKRKFGNMMVTFHIDVPGETMGKHSNEAFATKVAKEVLARRQKISLEKIIVTSADADSVFPPQYFSLLSYKYLTEKEPHYKIFQAPIFMHNNINRIPLLVRVPSIISGVFFLSLLQKYSKRFTNYSTYSLSLWLLDKVGYWDLDAIPEDSRLYFKSYFATSGKVTVVPLFLPLSIDAAESTSRWKTYQNSYQQNKRWAWGVIDIPYVIKNFFIHPEIGFWDKIFKVTLAIEWHFVWSSYWFLLVLGATIPTILNPVFARTALGFNLSRISSTILTIGLIGLFVIVFVDTLIYPHQKSRLRTLLHPLTYLQWFLLPISGLIFGSLPGLESQTRLMLGKYLEYRVTEKV